MTMNPDNREFDIDRLFANARQTEPDISGQNFTNWVMTSLPVETMSLLPISNRKASSVDLAALGLGALTTYWLFDTSNVVTTLVGLVPESIVINPASVMLTIVGLAAATALTWWSIENSDI